MSNVGCPWLLQLAFTPREEQSTCVFGHCQCFGVEVRNGATSDFKAYTRRSPQPHRLDTSAIAERKERIVVVHDDSASWIWNQHRVNKWRTDKRSDRYRNGNESATSDESCISVFEAGCDSTNSQRKVGGEPEAHVFFTKVIAATYFPQQSTSLDIKVIAKPKYLGTVRSRKTEMVIPTQVSIELQIIVEEVADLTAKR